jgi:PAS domain S-box-containing protein
MSDRAEIHPLSTLCDLVSALTRSKSTVEICDATLDSIAYATNADRAAVLLFASQGKLNVQASRRISEAGLRELARYSPWQAGCRSAQPLVFRDPVNDIRLLLCSDILEDEHLGALAFVPLESNAGVIGHLVLCYSDAQAFADEDLAVAQVVAGHVTLAIEHRRAEVALLQSQKSLQDILDNSPAVVFVKDIDGRYTLVNRRFEDLFGLLQSEVIGKTEGEVFSTELAAEEHSSDVAVLKAGRPLTLEEHIPHAGGMRTFLTVKFPVENCTGEITGICGIATDITERKMLEAAGVHLAAIVESSNDAIVGKDLNGIVTSWNKGAERIFGYKAEEMIGQPIATIAAPEVVDQIPTILEKIRRGERVEHFETRRRTKAGEIIDVSLTVSPVHDSSGKIIGASKIARDITHQKKIESDRASLLQRERDARKTAELLNRVGAVLATELSVSKLVQSVTDVARELVGAEFGSFFHNVVNEQGESYMLYTLSGAPREAFDKFPMPRNTEVFAPTFRGEGVVRSDDITKDPRYGRNAPHHGMPKGHLPVRSYLAAPVVSRSGEVLGGLFFGHSTPGMFTEQHENLLIGIGAQASIAMDNARLFEQAQSAQGKLTRSNEELRRANQDLETFAYSASHDLQEPLRTLGMTTQFLAKRYREHLPPAALPLLDTMVNSAQRMESLIRDVLAYATAGKQEQGPTHDVDANAVLTSVLKDLAAVIAGAKAEVTSTQLPGVRVHQNRLAQLFQNLISNGLKYCSEETPRVRISGTAENGWATFCVSDNGIGIDPMFANQIFGLFKRLHSQEQYPGSGIGLALCRRIVEQYGGRIWLESSNPGQGCTFCFTLPTA